MPRSRIILGDLAELEAAFAEAVASAKRPDPLAPVTVLCGHVLLKRYLPRMLARRGLAHINVRFLQPHELAALLVPPSPEPRLTPAAERLLVREAAGAAQSYFAGIPRGDGFADALRRLFRELEMGGFGDAPALEAALGASNPDGNGAKYADIAAMYGRYLQRRGEAGLAGPAALYGAAAAALDGPLLVYGVWSPSALQAALVRRIAQQTDVTVFLAASGLAIDDAHAGWCRELAAAGFTEERAPAQAPDVAPAIARLSRSLFRAEREAFEGEGITLLSAADTVREVWEAARACAEWAAAGIPFHEMAVAYRNREPYHGLVEEIFREAGIPTYLHDGSLLSRHPLGRRILLLLHLARDGEFSRRHVMEFLTETRVAEEVRGTYPGFRPAEWEAYSREAGIVGGIEQWRERLARLAAEKREKAKDERFEWMGAHAGRVEAFARFIDDFHAAIERRHAEAGWDDHLRWLREITSAYAPDAGKIVDALGELGALASVRPVVSFEEFCRAVEDDLGSRDASRVLGEPVREFGKHGVAVVDHTALRHLRFRAVWLLGVAERAWPPPVRPDPLLLEHERAALNGAGAGRVPLRTEPDEEALTFWLAVQSAGERLAVSYARADASGSGRHVPSYFFRAIADAVSGRTLDLESLETSGLVTRVNAGRLACGDPAAALTLTEYDRSLVRAFADRGEAGAVEAIAASWPHFKRALSARAARWSRSLSPFDGVLVDEASLRVLGGLAPGGERAVSPTRLETYAECPYRYFLRYVLRVEPLDEPESLDRMDNLERGSLIHAVLERFLRGLGRDDPPSFARRPHHLALLREALDAECAALEARGVTGRPLLWDLDRTQIFEDLERWYDRECTDRTGLKPGALEASFGISDAPADGVSRAEPLVVRAGGRELSFQGRIDRIDWDDGRTRFRVIDYKTGKRKAVQGYSGGEKLQLPVYLLAAADMLGLPPEAGHAEYFFATSGGGFRREGFTGDRLAATRDQFDAVLSTIADGVAGGFFAPYPKNGDNCRFCDYKDVCDARIARIAERKQDDARGAAFRAMKEIP